MGIDFHAITVIGLRIKLNDLKITEKITSKYINCKCKNNTNLFVYCPDCGNKNNFGTYDYFATNFIKEFCSSEGKDVESSEEDFGFNQGIIETNGEKYKVIRPTDQEDWIYITLYAGNRDGPRNYNKDEISKCEISLEELIKMKDKMKMDLTWVGAKYQTCAPFIDCKSYYDMINYSLWSDDKFGIYTIVDFNY